MEFDHSDYDRSTDDGRPPMCYVRNRVVPAVMPLTLLVRYPCAQSQNCYLCTLCNMDLTPLEIFGRLCSPQSPYHSVLGRRKPVTQQRKLTQSGTAVLNSKGGLGRQNSERQYFQTKSDNNVEDFDEMTLYRQFESAVGIPHVIPNIEALC